MDAEVRWRARRSILELDILLHRFIKTAYDTLSQQEKQQFYQWLLLEDHQLLFILQSKAPLAKKIIATMTQAVSE